MPKANTSGFSNALNDDPDVNYYGATEPDDNIEPLDENLDPNQVRQIERAVAADEKEEEESSAGTSSSTSGSKLGKSGSSSGTARQSRARTAASHSEPDQPAKPTHSSASTTDGSTQGTSSDPASLRGSSAESALAQEATADQGSDPGEKIEAAGKEIREAGHQLTEDDIRSGHASEEDPASGGFLTK
jgi:hypothetical protein